MAQVFQITHACLPVTALHTVQLNNDLLILAGHGSFLSVIDARTKNLLSCQRVFASAQIHGITSYASPADNNEPTPLLIWGGCFICFASLRVSDPDIDHPNTKLIFKEITIGASIRTVDWILDACFNYGPSSSVTPACLVTAHSDLVALQFGPSDLPFRFRTDILLHCPTLCRFSSGEDPLLYSARVTCEGSNGPLVITAGTISGHVLLLGSKLLPDRKLRLQEFPTGHKGAVFGVDRFKNCIVSSSDDREVRLGNLRRLSAASEMSGETKERASDTDDVTPVKPYFGKYHTIEICKHGSRVWGVKFVTIGTGLPGIVSIGEDGFCKFHQLRQSNLRQVTSDHYHVGKNIWSLADGQLGEEHLVITGGADGAIVSREISRRLPFHGSDTPEILRSPPKHGGSYLDHFETELSPLFAQLKIRAVARSGSDAKPPSIKQYEFTSHCCLLALTDSGYLLRGIAHEDTPVHNNPTGGDANVVPTDTSSMPSKWSFKHRFKFAFRARPVMSNSRDHLVFLGNSNGLIFVCFPEGVEDELQKCVVQLDVPISWLHIAGVENLSNSSREYCIVTYSDAKKGQATVVFVTISTGTDTTGAAHSPEQSALHTTDRFRSPINTLIEAKVGRLWRLGVDFEPTCATMLYSTRVLVIGSKRSGLLTCNPVHGIRVREGTPVFYRSTRIPWPSNDRITSISEISSHNPSDCREAYYLITVRNGMYSVLSTKVKGGRVYTKVLDLSTTPFGSSIEGSYCARAPQTLHSSLEQHPRTQFWTRQWQHEDAGRVNSGDLILYGFDSKKFVVWNESQRSLLVSIDCENAHRPWAYNTYAPEPEQGGQDCVHHGPFAWTQAKFLNVVTIGRPDHSLIQDGGHGREIKALSVSPRPYQDYRHGILNGRLVATGAEDTCIRLFAIGASTEAHTQNKMICIRTLKQHTTGVQHLSFSPCGEWLFSAGGGEEMYAWHIRQGVPGIHLAVKLEYIFPRHAINKSDVRITDFKADLQDDGTFHLSAVYSDSMINFFHFNGNGPAGTTEVDMLRWFYYVERCTVGVDDHVENGTLTAGTQGKCLTQINHYGDGEALTASTDGSIVFWCTRGDALPYDAQPYGRGHVVHQNSIKAMHTVDLTPEHPSHHHRLVITGGDDNALGLTLMRVKTSTSPPSVEMHEPAFQSLLIPNAHAAAITAICVQRPLIISSYSTTAGDKPDPQEIGFWFLSTGNDQRLKLWFVEVDLAKMGVGVGVGASGGPDAESEQQEYIGGQAMAAVRISLIADQLTDVADAGAMELVSELQVEGDAFVQADKRETQKAGRRDDQETETSEGPFVPLPSLSNKRETQQAGRHGDQEKATSEGPSVPKPLLALSKSEKEANMVLRVMVVGVGMQILQFVCKCRYIY